jgi:hypothetical protein
MNPDMPDDVILPGGEVVPLPLTTANPFEFLALVLRAARRFTLCRTLGHASVATTGGHLHARPSDTFGRVCHGNASGALFPRAL